MNCPSCGHGNLTDFPFCEQCLALLPVRAGATELAGFEVDAPGALGGGSGRHWPAFPWNPPTPEGEDPDGPLIGREKARRELEAAWDDVVTHWRARIHLLVSEYGMGKSRVASAFLRAARRREPDVFLVRARCPTTGGPFRLWDALLREAFGIPQDADPLDAGLRFEKAIEEVLPDEAGEVTRDIAWLTGWDVPGRAVPGAGVDEEALVSRGAGATARLLSAVSTKKPVLVVVDHAHRASVRSLALAGAMEATLKGRPVMLLLTGAPGLAETLPGWDRFPVTRLAPLGRSHAEKMLRLYLDGLGDVPKELVRRVLDHAHGNPYALKSLVRYLRSAGAIVPREGAWSLDETVAWDLAMPEDLPGLVLAQVTAMPPEDRRVLARAAVVGEEFWLGALVALERQDSEEAKEPGVIRSDGAPASIRASLDRLAERRFVERRPGRLPGEETWGFRSEIHLQVARGILPATTQERHHKAIWRWLEVHVGRDPGDHLADLARHAEAAGAAGQAARYLLAASRRAKDEHHHAEERRLLEAAGALADADDTATRLSIDFDLGDALSRAGDPDGALERYQAVLNLAWRTRHRGKGAAALSRIGRIERDRGAYDRAWQHSLHALHLFEAVQDRPGVAAACLDLGQLFWLRADFDQALRFLRKAEDLFRRLRDRRGLAECVHAIGGVHVHRGDLVLAEEYLEDALELRRRLDDPIGVARTLTSLGALRFGQGRPVEAVTAWEEGLELARAQGDLQQQAMIANNLGETLTTLARHESARRHLEDAIGWAEEADAPRTVVDARRNLARLHARRGEWLEAALALGAARRKAEDLGLRYLVAMVDQTEGELQAERAQAGEGERVEALGRAEEALARAAADLEEAGYELDAAQTRERLADVLEAAGRPDEAAAARSTAEYLRGRGSRPSPPPEAASGVAE